MSACVIPVLERFRRGNKSARARSRKAIANSSRESKETVMAPDTVRMMMPRSSSVPPEPRSRRGIALEEPEEEEEERDVVGVPHLPQRDSRGFTIFRSNGLSVRHDHPTLGLGDAAYQRQHQAHRMNLEQYQELQRQLSSERAPSRGVMSLGLPDNLRPGTLFRRIRNDLYNGSSSNLDSSNGSDRRSSLPRRTKKLPSTFSVESPHFYSSLKRGGSFSSGRGSSDSTSCTSVEAAAEAGMAVAAFIPPVPSSNGPMGRRRPPSYLLPKALSPCPPAKMHPFIPNLGRTLQQQRAATVDRKGRPVRLQE